MEHYVNIMLDSGFKAVFGDKQVMMDFINAALYDEREVDRPQLHGQGDLPGVVGRSYRDLRPTLRGYGRC